MTSESNWAVARHRFEVLEVDQEGRLSVVFHNAAPLKSSPP